MIIEYWVWRVLLPVQDWLSCVQEVRWVRTR